MTHIHSTAIVDPQAQLAPDVHVGPYCIITGKVVIGAGTRLISNVQLQGPLTIGQRNVLYPFVCAGFEPQYFADKGATAGVAIGNDNTLREYVTVHRSTGATPTCLGNNNLMMVNAHLGHDAVMGDWNNIANGALIAGHARIADRVVLGGNSLVHQFCRVGRLSMISGGVGVTKDLPPFCVVYKGRCVQSLNIVGLRRAGLREHIKPLTEVFRVLLMEQHVMPVAIELAEQRCGDDPLCREMIDFFKSSTRGVTRYSAMTGDSA